MFELPEIHLQRATLRALITLKFECDVETVHEYAGSPQIAEVCNRLYDTLIASYRSQLSEGPAHRLEKGRDATDRRFEKDAFYSHLRLPTMMEWWASAPREKKDTYVRMFMSPYTVSEPVLEEIIAKADGIVNKAQIAS